MKPYLYIAFLLFAMANFAQSGPLFEQGKELYKAEKYQEAVNSWMKILENKEHSSALYFNLGNAHYKLNNIGSSIYYYERALQLAPNNSDIKNNLAFAQNTTIDDIEPLPETIFSKWYKSISGILTYNGWAITTVIFSMGFVALFLLYYFSTSEKRKRFLFTSSLLFIVLLLVSLSMAFTIYNDSINNYPAIIFSESIEVRIQPNLGGEITFTLHEGTKVQILTRDNDWVRIVIADGKDGWIPASDLKEL